MKAMAAFIPMGCKPVVGCDIAKVPIRRGLLGWCGNWVTIAIVERKLGIVLPVLLRTVYLHTSLRSSQMVHLLALPKLKLHDGALRLASEQQSCWDWGIGQDQLTQPNPAIVANPGGVWQQDGCTLDDFLRFLALAACRKSQ